MLSASSFCSSVKAKFIGVLASARLAVRGHAVLDPLDHEFSQHIAVVFHHHHMPVTYNAEIAEIEELRGRAIFGQPTCRRLIERTRMVDIVAPGQYQDRF